MSTISLFRRGSTTSVSGSPKRALNSITLMPSRVFIRPPYSTPVKGHPSAHIASAVGCMIRSNAYFSSSAVTNGSGE